MMNFVKKLFLPQLILFLLCTGFFACENDIATVNSITSALEKKLPAESGKNVEIIYSDSAKVRAKLSAVQLDRYIDKKTYMLMPKGMKVLFYNTKGEEQTKLTANYGIGFDNGNGMEHMEAKGNVIVINEKGDKLNTEHLIWNAITKKIYTNEFVKITTKDEVIMGEGLEANEDFSEYEIKKVKGKVGIKEQ